MAIKRIVTPERFVGLSTDTKPTDGATSVRPGATFYEYDTLDLYITHDGTNWVLKDPGIGYLEDAAHASGDPGMLALGVRSDTAAALAGTTGDYQPFIFDANGRLHVLDQNSAAIATSLALLDNAIPSGNELQVDVVAALPAGTNVIGKVRTVTATGDEVTNDTKDAVKTDARITKTIQTELIAITAVAADVQSISSTLDLSGQTRQATILIDHAKDNANASVGQGTEYVVQVSEKATGNDTWRALASFTATITAPTVITTDAEEAAGQTLIEIGATTPVVGDILFFKNGTIANSEWANVIAVVAATTCTLESGLTNTQAQGTYNTQGEHFVVTINVESVTRLRVVCNNTKGSTNRAICWRCAAITSE